LQAFGTVIEKAHVVVRSKLAQWQTRILELLLLQLRHTTIAKQRVAVVGVGRVSLLSALLEVELFAQSRQNHRQRTNS
jgi:hypothetical protein